VKVRQKSAKSLFSHVIVEKLCAKKVIAMINAIQSGEFHSPHKTNRTGMCDEAGAWCAMVLARPAGTGKNPGLADWSISCGLRAIVPRAGYRENCGAPV
jgi:hypothetical protein